MLVYPRLGRRQGDGRIRGVRQACRRARSRATRCTARREARGDRRRPQAAVCGRGADRRTGGRSASARTSGGSSMRRRTRLELRVRRVRVVTACSGGLRRWRRPSAVAVLAGVARRRLGAPPRRAHAAPTRRRSARTASSSCGRVELDQSVLADALARDHRSLCLLIERARTARRRSALRDCAGRAARVPARVHADHRATAGPAQAGRRDGQPRRLASS